MTVLLLAGACHTRGARSPDYEDPLKNAPPVDKEALEAMNRPPPPPSQEEPDLEYFKDLSRRSAKQAAMCDVPANTGPRGIAEVDLSFEPAGRIGKIVVHSPHEGTPIGACVARAFEGVPSTPFKGEAVVIQQSVEFKDVTEGGKKKKP